jgi:protein-S-isoprenylcysteine O-methyltransferase Ste14
MPSPPLPLVPPPLIALALAGVMWMSGRAFPAWRIASTVLAPVAFAIGTVAMLIFFAAAIQFLRHRTTINPVAPGRASTLITSGIYRLSRNPIYLADFLLLAAFAIWLGHPLALPFPFLFVWIMNRWQIAAEERALRGLFGDQYARYCASVRRWL